MSDPLVKAWSDFDTAAKAAAATRIADQFAAAPARIERMSVDVAGLHFDLSKQSWTAEAFDACLALAEASDLHARKLALFNGEAVNGTEGRAVLHPALRAPAGARFEALGKPVSAEVETVRAEMKAYAEAVRSGAASGATGKRFEAIVHIGIGGSDLGPRLVWDALRPLDPAIDLRFVANIDPRDMAEALTGLNPETTLVVVVSKTFTTQETLANAEAAKAWLKAGLSSGMEAHFIGVTAAPDKAAAFGRGRTFGFRHWVGGRYSRWSAVALSCAIALGWGAFPGWRGCRSSHSHGWGPKSTRPGGSPASTPGCAKHSAPCPSTAASCSGTRTPTCACAPSNCSTESTPGSS